MNRSRSKSSFALSVGAFALLAGACVDAKSPGVRTDALQADIVFGVEASEEAELATLAPPPPPAEAGQPITVTPVLNVPFKNKLPDRFKNVAFTVSNETAAANACPTAGLGTPPRELAGRDVTNLPLAGLYRFKVSGTQTLTVNGVDIPTAINGFEPRLIENVEQASDSTWRFDVVQPSGNGARVTTWFVNADPQELRNPSSADEDGDGLGDGRGVKPPYVGENAVRAGEPGRGIAIERIVDFDSDGNTIGSFDAVPELLQLPLPVLPGEGFSAVAVDRQGQSIQVEGEVEDRQTVDACGDVLDGWLVSQTITTAQSLDSSVSTEEYIFATTMGGLPISHRVTGQTVDPATGVARSFDITYSIGQAEPTPVPGDAG